MAKTLRRLLLPTVLMSIFLISSFQSRGAALTNFSWSSTSNYPSAFVTYTFSYKITTAAPNIILYAYEGSAYAAFDCSGVSLASVIVTINGTQAAINTTPSTGSGVGYTGIVIRLVNPALAVANSNIVIKVPNVHSTYVNGSYPWGYIQTANITGSAIDAAVSPSPIIVETFAPTTQATNVIFSSVQATQMTASWTNGNGENRAVFMKQASSGSATPANGTIYGANPAFGTGSSYYQIGATGWYCIYNGTGTTVNVTNLTASTAYQVHVCEYNGPTYDQAYNTTSPTGNPILLTSTPSTPTGTAAQTFCSGATVTSLAATGTAILWYAAASGGTALSTSLALVNATHYYASQTIGGIESGGRLDVTATVNSAPAAPTSVSATPALLCSGASSVLNGVTAGNYINWYTIATGGTALGYSASGVNYAITPGSTTIYYAETILTPIPGSQTIAYSGAIVNFTVPAGVTTLTIDAKGAQGGYGTTTYTGGLGARMKGDFSVTPGQILKVLVGQQGGNMTSYRSGGGGGGTFVVTNANAPLVIAGGGSGGGGYAIGTVGNPGLITQSGGNSAPNSGGTPGNGGGTDGSSAGGGGLTGNGSTTTCAGLSPGLSFINGGTGGSVGSTGGIGGFGGGSGGEVTCNGSTGAGGGYSGGAGAHSNGVAGAGGSINNGINQTNTSGYQSGDGQVNFSWVVFTGCPSATRTPVTVTVNTTTVPTGAASQSYCTGSTVANLTATGTGLLWYNAASGGTALTTSTVLVSGNHYYATQTVGSFESCTRLDVLVTVNAILVAPTPVAATPATICAGSSSVLMGTSAGNTINWYTVATGGTAFGSSISGANYPVSPGTSTTYYAETIPTTTNSTQTIDYTGTIVNFTIPAGVTTLTIDAKGAQGGTGKTYTGGLGARMKGDITVSPGQILKILVGQMGYSTASYSAGGGGGGTFVTSIANDALIIAGGGSGGGGNTNPSNGNSGLITESGGNATGATGGVGGLGGGAAGGSAGGGGLTGNGGATSCASHSVGYSFSNGGAGGTSVNGGKGGFGGGSGGEWSCLGSTGAGGGYSGGAGSNNGGVAGAGGSKNTGTNQTNTSGSQSSNGQVILSWTSTGSGCPSATRTAVTVTVNPTVAAPTGTAAQTFCSGATVANLSATGTGILWYAASTGGTALATTTVLVTATHYYASQTLNGCESASRLDITATVNTTATPTGTAQTFCSGATVANLFVNGTGILWYTASSGGTALATTTVLVNATHYYATQTLNGCESIGRYNLAATVITTAAPTGTTAQTFCSGATVANLSATGTNMAWYATPTGGSYIGSYIPLVNGTHYYASQSDLTYGCASPIRLNVTATVNTTATPTGTAAQTFCSSSTVASLTATGTSILWYAAASGGASLATSGALVNGTHYYASQTLNGCPSINRLNVTATVNPTVTAPTGTASQTFYSVSTVADLSTIGTGILWYAASTGGVALASSVVLSNGAHYYASQTDAITACESISRFDVTATVYSTPVITSFTPLTAAGGATITITGTDFTSASAVSFGGTAAASFSVVDFNTIRAVIAGGMTGTISVTAPGGTSTSSVSFTFIPIPTITSFTPTTAAPGATVTITGTNFSSATAVSFGGTAAASFSVVDINTITAVVADGATGTIVVTTPGGTASSGESLTFSQTQTWTGSTSSDWNTAGNWNTNGVPLLNDHIIIPNVTSKPVISDLTIGSGGSVTIAPGSALTVSGTLTNNSASGPGGLVIQSDGSGTGSLINGTSGVSATVARWMTGDIWHLVSPAATAAITPTVADFAGNISNLIAYYGTSYGLAPYKESDDTWTYYGYPTPLGSFDTPGKGYEILRGTTDADGTGTHSGNDGTVSFKGTLAAGNLTTSISKSGNGWNLIGNPFPCGLDITKFLEDAGNSSAINSSYLAIYVRDISPAGILSGGYTAINNTDKLLLSSGEGFLIKALAPVSLSFTTAMKSITSDAFKSADAPYPGITLSAHSGAQTCSTVVKYIPGMTSGLDPGWDAGLFNGSATAFSLFTRLVKDNGVDFCIQALPDNDYENMVIPVGLVAAKGSTISFKAEVANLPSNMKVYLEDKITTTTTRLDDGSDYSVVLSSDIQGSGRFYLRTTSIVSAVPGDLAIDLKIVPLPLAEIVRLLGNVTLPAVASVYDMTGRLITQKTLVSSYQNDIPLVNVNNGVYLVKIDSRKALITKKVVWLKF